MLMACEEKVLAPRRTSGSSTGSAADCVSSMAASSGRLFRNAATVASRMSDRSFMSANLPGRESKGKANSALRHSFRITALARRLIAAVDERTRPAREFYLADLLYLDRDRQVAIPTPRYAC